MEARDSVESRVSSCGSFAGMESPYCGLIGVSPGMRPVERLKLSCCPARQRGCDGDALLAGCPCELSWIPLHCAPLLPWDSFHYKTQKEPAPKATENEPGGQHEDRRVSSPLCNSALAKTCDASTPRAYDVSSSSSYHTPSSSLRWRRIPQYPTSKTSSQLTLVRPPSPQATQVLLTLVAEPFEDSAMEDDVLEVDSPEVRPLDLQPLPLG